MTKHFGYRPLADLFEIKDSQIEGKGLFARVDIHLPETDDPTVLWDYKNQPYRIITHRLIDGELIRDCHGGWLNHSENPNCKLVGIVDDYNKFDTIFYLVPIKKIYAGEEITLNYDVHCMCGKP